MQWEPETIWFLALLYSQCFKKDLWGYKGRFWRKNRISPGTRAQVGWEEWKCRKGKKGWWGGWLGSGLGGLGPKMAALVCSVPCHQLYCPTRFTSQSWPVPQPLTSLATSQRAGNQGFHCRASAQDKPWTYTAWWRCLDTQPLAHRATFQPLR